MSSPWKLACVDCGVTNGDAPQRVPLESLRCGKCRGQLVRERPYSSTTLSTALTALFVSVALCMGLKERVDRLEARLDAVAPVGSR
jgi:hypothetical protein